MEVEKQLRVLINGLCAIPFASKLSLRAIDSHTGGVCQSPQLSIARLFGLTDGKIYTRLGELAGEELEKKKNGIEKSFSLIRPYKMGRAFKSYSETLDKIETLKAQFIKA